MECVPNYYSSIFNYPHVVVGKWANIMELANLFNLSECAAYKSIVQWPTWIIKGVKQTRSYTSRWLFGCMQTKSLGWPTWDQNSEGPSWLVLKCIVLYYFKIWLKNCESLFNSYCIIKYTGSQWSCPYFFLIFLYYLVTQKQL